MKKSLSLFLVIAILATMFVGVKSFNTSAASVANVNLFYDGDFENSNVSGTNIPQGEQSTNFDNWYRTGYAGATVVGSTEDHYSGEKSLKLSVQSNYENTYAYYKNIKVEPNTNYSISFMYKATEMKGNFRAVVTSAFNEENKTCRYLFTDQSVVHTYNDDKGNTTSVLTSSLTGDWIKASVSFNSGENEVLRLYFRLRGQANSGPGTAGNCTVFVDDIVLNSHGLAFNGGFESWGKADTSPGDNVVATNIWQRQSTASTCGKTLIGSNDTAHTGARSFKFAATASRSAYYLNFNVEKNAYYRVTFWYKITTAGEFRGAVGTTSMTALDNATGRLLPFGAGVNAITSSITSDWVKVQKTFNSGDNTLLRIMFWMAQNGVAFLDDLCIEKVGSTPAADVEGNVFNDGTFEKDNYTDFSPSRADNTTDVNTWYRPVYGNMTAIGNSRVYSLEDQHTGEKSFKLSASNASYSYIFYKNFNVETNTNYTVSYWYKMTEANGQFRSSVANTSTASTDSNKDLCPMGGDKNTLVSSAVTDGWVKVERRFNSGENTTLRLILMLYSLSGSTTVYIDDISVVKLPDPPTIVDSDRTSVTLTANEAYEYAINDGEWVSNPVFTGLVSGVTYTFKQRAKAHDDYIAGPASEATSYLIAVAGDTNANGSRDNTDFTALRNALLTETGSELDAYGKDANEDNLFDICDLVALKKQLIDLNDAKFTVCNVDIKDFTVYSTVTTEIGTKAADEFISSIKTKFAVELRKSETEDDFCIKFVLDENIGADAYSVAVNGTKLVFTAGSESKLLDAVRMFDSRLGTVTEGQLCGVQKGYLLND